MSPKFLKYGSNSLTFKQSPVDLQLVDRNEKEAVFERALKNLLKAKNESNERKSARQLERYILQFKSK